MTRNEAEARARLGRRALIARLVGAHFLCYPLMFVGAVAGMSLAIVLQKPGLLAAARTSESTTEFQRWLVANVALRVPDAAAFELIMRPIGWVLAAIFVLTHVAAVPWALVARRCALGDAHESAVKRAKILWVLASLGTTGVLVVGGVVGWAIILLSA